MKKLFVSLVAGALSVLPAFAGDGSNDRYSKNFHEPILTQNVDESYFRAHEWFADVYGSYTAATHGLLNSGGGGGASIGYYFTKNFGIDVEGLTFDGGSTADTVNDVNGNLLARLPLDTWWQGVHLAPYAFAGGGELWNSFNSTPFWDAGLGVEYRFTKNWGVFTDGRYVDPESTNQYGLARVGVRFAF